MTFLPSAVATEIADCSRLTPLCEGGARIDNDACEIGELRAGAGVSNAPLSRGLLPLRANGLACAGTIEVGVGVSFDTSRVH